MSNSAEFRDMEIPTKALQFSLQENIFLSESEQKEDGSEEVKISVMAYTGKVINHWYWGPMAIDVDGGRYTKTKYPFLEEHALSLKLGFTSKPKSDGKKLTLDPGQITLLDNPDAALFSDNVKKGFPYQASIFAMPYVVEEVAPDADVEVNGYTFSGPGTVIREWEYMECSACVFGADDNTSVDVKNSGKSELIKVKLIRTEGIKMTTEKSDDQKNVREPVQIVSDPLALKDLDSLKEQMIKMQAEVVALTKDIVLLTETVYQNQAELRLSSLLNASKIPERMHDKVRLCIKYTTYMSKDGFDNAAFEKDAKAEISDWEAKLGHERMPIGLSAEGENQGPGSEQAETVSMVEGLYKLSAQATSKPPTVQ